MLTTELARINALCLFNGCRSWSSKGLVLGTFASKSGTHRRRCPGGAPEGLKIWRGTGARSLSKPSCSCRHLASFSAEKFCMRCRLSKRWVVGPKRPLWSMLWESPWIECTGFSWRGRWRRQAQGCPSYNRARMEWKISMGSWRVAMRLRKHRSSCHKSTRLCSSRF